MTFPRWSQAEHAFQTFGESRWMVAGIAGAVLLLVALIAFEVGVLAGYRQANFSEHWGQNYARNFGEVRGPGGLGKGPGVPEGHGAFGHVVSVSLPNFVMASANQPEQTIHLTSDTVIRDLDQTVGQNAVTAGSLVIVIGDPNDAGQIDARFVRILPEPTREPSVIATSTVPK